MGTFNEFNKMTLEVSWVVAIVCENTMHVYITLYLLPM